MFSSCIDIGGTFTDLIVSSPSGVEIFKSPTTPPQFEAGFMNALALAADHYGLPLGDFLAANDLIVHGTTVSTNALVEGKTVPTGLLCNAGHPDILTIREAPRKRAFTVHLDYPRPFIPRNRTCEIGGRIDALGHEIEPLNRADVLAAIVYLRKCEIEAIAVSLLWSTVNPNHELQVRDIIAETWPDIPVTLGHALNPVPREYRRTISAAINASLQPIVASYTERLVTVLRDAGYEKEFLVANCVGGMMPPAEIVKQPIYSVMSGPTLAPVAAANLTDAGDVIVVDMGGTTFDVSAIRDRQIIVTPEAKLGMDLLGIPKIDVRSVGAGGGSIAWIDAGGLLNVGPESASSFPGPACYGRGGTRPTVTDANVVLGIIDPANFLGGRMAIDPALARDAIATIAGPLGLSIEAAAWAIYTTVNHNMIGAIEDITIMEGLDPRQCFMVSGGGATACHIGDMARIVGIERLMVPKLAAGLSAYGGLLSDIRWEKSATLHHTSRRFDVDAVNDVLAQLREVGADFLARAGVPREAWSYSYGFQARYLYQSWDIEVGFDCGADGLETGDLERLSAAFHDQHERIYSIRDDNDIIEFTSWKVRVTGDVGGSARKGKILDSHRDEVTPARWRAVYLDGNATTLPVYDGSGFGAGASVRGPAIIEESTTTLLLLEGQVANTDEYGNYVIHNE